MSPEVLISAFITGIILGAGFVFGELARLVRLPKVTGYILAGICINPQILPLIPADFSTHTNLVTNVALSFITFSVGGTLPQAYGDETGMTYDSKRNCLWLARNGSPMLRCDLETGALTAIATPRPDKVWMRETAYVPELDMLLNVGRVEGPDGQAGNLAFDIEHKKWVGLALPMSDSKPHLYDNGYWPVSLVLRYDPTLKVAVFLLSTQEIFVARFDTAGLRTFEAPLQEPKQP